MKLIVGLGNPGRIYIDSRHNIGFSVVRSLSRLYKIPLKKEKGILSLSGRGKIEGQLILLALPLTFMNLSGLAARELVKKYKIDLSDLLVVCDDLDLSFGRLKIRRDGSSAGHRGIKSIIDSLGSKEFCRLRIGIGRPSHQLIHKNIKDTNWCGGRPQNAIDSADYVLAPFNKKERERVEEIIDNACDALRVWVGRGITEAMNIFNRSN